MRLDRRERAAWTAECQVEKWKAAANGWYRGCVTPVSGQCRCIGEKRKPAGSEKQSEQVEEEGGGGEEGGERMEKAYW